MPFIHIFNIYLAIKDSIYTYELNIKRAAILTDLGT